MYGTTAPSRFLDDDQRVYRDGASATPHYPRLHTASPKQPIKDA